MRNRDPLGYYAALRVGPDATSEEIRLSYELLKAAHRGGTRLADIGRILAAHETLSDPRRRREYDEGRGASAAQLLEQVRPWLGSPITLAVVALLLVAVVGTLFGPTLVAELKSYSVGDELAWKAGPQPLGRIVAFEPEHVFSNGVTAPAYEVIPPGGGASVWYPARDLQRHARRAELTR